MIQCCTAAWKTCMHLCFSACQNGPDGLLLKGGLGGGLRGDFRGTWGDLRGTLGVLGGIFPIKSGGLVGSDVKLL